MPNLYQAAAGMDALEQLAANQSVVHRLHPMAKLAITMAYIVLVISFSPTNVSGLVPFLLYPVVLMAVSGTPYRPVFMRLAIALPFSLAGGLSNLFFLRDPAFVLGAFTVSQGAIACTSIILKTLLTVLAILVLIATTSFVDISYQLTKLRIPKIICLQLIMTYRYISVLLEEAATMYTAYTLRAPGQKGVLMKHMGNFLGQLILRSFDRAERVYQAMKCRGFQGVYCGKYQGGVTTTDTLFTALALALLLLFRFFNVSLFLGRLVG